MEAFMQANLFELSRGDIHVTYSTTNILGGPIFSYRDNQLSRSFRGEEICIQDTCLGQLVTVTLETIPDLRTVSFTLIVPIVTVMSPVYWNPYQGARNYRNHSHNNCRASSRTAAAMLDCQSSRNGSIYSFMICIWFCRNFDIRAEI